MENNIVDTNAMWWKTMFTIELKIQDPLNYGVVKDLELLPFITRHEVGIMFSTLNNQNLDFCILVLLMHICGG